MVLAPPPVRTLRAPLLLTLLGISLLTPRTEVTAAPPAAAETISSGLSVVIPATGAPDLIARAQNGRVLVHALTPDPALAARLRAEIDKAGATGLVSVMVWQDFPALPYAEELVNHLVVDADALPTPPSEQEIDRVLIPKWGIADLRVKGAWTRKTKPLPAGYGEWTHYYHDHTNNPVNGEEAGIVTGLRWITGSTTDGENHSYFGSGKLVDVVTTQRAYTATLITVREAFNGLPVWRKVHGDTKKVSSRRYEPNVIAGDRIIRLRTSAGPLVAVSLTTGEEEVVYEGMPIHALQPNESMFVPATAAGGVGAMAVVFEGTLYAASGDTLGAFDVQTGKTQWLWKSPEGGFLGYPCIDAQTGVLAVGRGEKAMASSRITAFRMNKIHGFDRKSGRLIWNRESPVPDNVALISSYEGGIYLQTAAHLGTDKVSLVALDARTGDIRWSQIDRDMPGVGTMMIYPGRMYVVRSSFHAFDLADGTPLGTWSLGNSRCDVPRGGRHLINNFGHFLNVGNKDVTLWDRREITRNSCGGASIPAYGLRYSTDNRCSCFDAVRGRVAQGATPVPPPTPDAQRLVRGPAYARPLTRDVPGWNALLGNDRRSGAGGPLKSNAPKKRWQTVVSQPTGTGPIPAEWRDGDNWNGPITPPTVAGGRVYVGESVGHGLVCLNADSGQVLWRFPTDARIDGPPRIARGRVVFGSRDGNVYCLDAADGQLAWRFQAAAAKRWITAFGQMESAWPLRGSLPVIDDLVIAPAGYHPEADGGIHVWALDIGTGAVRWKRVLDRERPTVKFNLAKGTGKEKVPSEAFDAIFQPSRVTNMEIVANGKVFKMGGAVLFVADGTDAPRDHPDLYLLPSWNAFSMPHRRPIDYNPRGPGGYSGVWGQVGSKLFGFDKEGKRNGKPGVPGRPICMDDKRIVIQATSIALGPLWCFAKSAAADGAPPLWQIKDNLRGPRDIELAPNSMILAGETAVMTATRISKGTTPNPSAPLEVRSLADGSLMHREELAATTVDHGLAVADGRLYMSLVDGSVLCME
jgi:outer membrane protein assembly factor BamB